MKPERINCASIRPVADRRRCRAHSQRLLSLNFNYRNIRGWSHNTEFSVDLKTILRSDPRAVDGKTYQGVLRRDVDCDEYRYDDHFTFVETCPKTPQKHNPQVFGGKYITITQRDDGTYRPNLKPIVIGDGFDIDGFATDVANELLWALEGLVGKSE